MAAPTYPARLDARLDEPLSRWLWLVKWLLALPHVVVLAFLWAGMAALTVVAGVAILVTGRYPRSIFDVNVGVLRWTWRVQHYATVLGTDRYPPFTLRALPDDPARFEVDYPEQGLSRGLVLVKWWLLALPHYLVIGLFGGGLTAWGTGAGAGTDGTGRIVLGGGLVGLLVLVAAVLLAVTGRYHRALFDLVMGMQRWVYRVLAYAALMRDEYPPFRLDTGGTDPGSADPPGGDALEPPAQPRAA